MEFPCPIFRKGQRSGSLKVSYTYCVCLRVKKGQRTSHSRSIVYNVIFFMPNITKNQTIRSLNVNYT